MSLADQDAWAGRKRFIDTGNVRTTYVDVEGTEPALLLIHGFTDSSRSFSLLAPHLAGSRLIIPDLRGHGVSLTSEERFGIADFADDIAVLIRTLGLERAVLVGHSLGAMVAIATAARHPELHCGLALLAGTIKPDMPDDHAIPLGVGALRDPISPSDPFYAYWHDCRPTVPPSFLAWLAEEASQMPATRWRTILHELRGADLTGAARQMAGTAPLIVAGGSDPLFGDPHLQALTRAFPSATVVRLDNCGHNVHWEEPALVAAAIKTRFRPWEATVTGMPPTRS